MTVASDWLRAKMMVVSSTRELRPLMKIYPKEITSKKIIRLTHCLKRRELLKKDRKTRKGRGKLAHHQAVPLNQVHLNQAHLTLNHLTNELVRRSLGSGKGDMHIPHPNHRKNPMKS